MNSDLMMNKCEALSVRALCNRNVLHHPYAHTVNTVLQLVHGFCVERFLTQVIALE